MNIAIIFAGGSGVRMGAGVPKQFLEINGKPILVHTLNIFEQHHEIDKIYVAVIEEYIDYVKALAKEFSITKLAGIVSGGSSAQESTYRALKLAQQDNHEVSEEKLVLIHDGVRPLVSYDVISKNIAAVKKYGSAITSTSCHETVLISQDGENVSELPLRKHSYSAQAPQSFYLEDIIEAHECIRQSNPDYTDVIDSCTLMKSIGRDTHLVEGNRENIKVTTPEDVFIFKGLLDYVQTEQAFGIGISDKIKSRIYYQLERNINS